MVETDAGAGHEEKAKAGVAMIHVISDRTQVAHHAVNTREVMIANQGAVIHEIWRLGRRQGWKQSSLKSHAEYSFDESTETHMSPPIEAAVPLLDEGIPAMLDELEKYIKGGNRVQR